jgi:hypothetical protein
VRHDLFDALFVSPVQQYEGDYRRARPVLYLLTPERLGSVAGGPGPFSNCA